MIPRNVRYLLVVLIGLSILACDNVTEQPDYRPEPSIDSPAPDLTREVTPSPAPSSTPQPLPTVRPSPTPSQPAPPLTPQPPPTPIAPGSGGISQGSFTKPLNLPQLVAQSTVIVAGTIDESRPREESIPTGNPAQRYLVRVYDIHVERYLKGKGDEILSVIQFDRIVSTNQSQNKVGQGRAMPSGEILPTRGSRYILFLTENAHAEGLWQLPGRPYKSGSGLAELPLRAL